MISGAAGYNLCAVGCGWNFLVFFIQKFYLFREFWNSKGRNDSIERSNTKLGWKNAENWPWVSKIFENLVFIHYIAVTAAGVFLKNQQRLARLHLYLWWLEQKENDVRMKKWIIYNMYLFVLLFNNRQDQTIFLCICIKKPFHF